MSLINSAKLHQEIIKLTNEIYDASERRVIPSYQRVLLYILPKRQKVGSIFLPDKQNKPVHEGIVLALWKRKEHWSRIYDKETKRTNDVKVLQQTALKLGDHVLLPHSAGVPLDSDTDRLRMVREEEILATIEHSSSHEQKGVEKLAEIIYASSDMTVINALGASSKMEADALVLKTIVKAICDQFILVDKATTSVTLSGK